MKKLKILILIAGFALQTGIAQTTHRVDVSIDQSNINECITNIDEPNEAKISVLPNPSSGIFLISPRESFFSGEVNIVVYDLMGKKIFSKQVNSLEGYNRIDLSEVSKGYYIIRINAKNKSYSSQLIIK
jgi:hypothetical protein